MSPRLRVSLLAAAAAAAAAALAVGVTLLQSDDTAASQEAAPAGDPPLVLDLAGSDAAAELGRAVELYGAGRREEAARIFARHGSPEAEVGLAMARWPDGTVPRLRELARDHPRSGIVRLNLGFALFWSGAREEALAAWRDARRVDPDSPAAVRAGDLLHPGFARGLPVFVLGPESTGRVRRLLLEGIGHQRAGRPVSARRAFDAAAAAAPRNPEALAASAVGRFDKAEPSLAFSRLGPLARRFPRAPTVRFHLGLLLLWMGQAREGERQLELARAIDPAHPLAREAARILERLERTG